MYSILAVYIWVLLLIQVLLIQVNSYIDKAYVHIELFSIKSVHSIFKHVLHNNNVMMCRYKVIPISYISLFVLKHLQQNTYGNQP